jgi:hypothetical protein
MAGAMCMAFSCWRARNDALEGVRQDKEAGIEPWSDYSPVIGVYHAPLFPLRGASGAPPQKGFG